MEHWMAVGVVSDLARAELYRANCPVVELQQPQDVMESETERAAESSIEEFP